MRTILLLLGSDDLHFTLAEVLKRHYTVTTCFDAVTGAACLSQRPDALIIDLSLQGTDGISFLTDHYSNLPPVIIALANYVDTAAIHALSSIGVQHTYLKPFSLRALERQLRMCLNEKIPLPNGRGEIAKRILN